MTISYIKASSLFVLIFFCSIDVKAQEDFSVFVQPEFSVNIDTQKRWSFNFATANRNLVYMEEKTDFRAKFIEIIHFTGYEIGFHSKLSLGARYRFREIFEEVVTDEIRLSQQYAYSRKFNILKVAHRLTQEERFRENTSFRTRYEFSLEVPLKGERVDPQEFYLIGDTEALWSYGNYRKPSFEHRVGLFLGNNIMKNTKARLGLEYRLDDYTNDPASELFIYTAVSVSL